jgi:hypothetical protein
MPMIDICATRGTFQDVHQLAIDATPVVKGVEGVPDIPLFRKNTAAFVHEMREGALSNVDGDTNYVPIHVTTNPGALVWTCYTPGGIAYFDGLERATFRCKVRR